MFEVAQLGDAEMGLAGQAGAHGIGAHLLGIVSCQKQLAVGGQVQRRVAANGAYHLHARALAVGAFHIDNLVALAHGQADGLLNLLVKLTHGGQRHFTYVQPGLDQVAQFQKAHAQAVAARFGAIHKAAQCKVIEYAVRGRWMQARAFADLLQRNRFLTRCQHVDQREHAFQNLDAGLCGGR